MGRRGGDGGMGRREGDGGGGMGGMDSMIEMDDQLNLDRFLNIKTI
jgi:hypothetical protein